MQKPVAAFIAGRTTLNDNRMGRADAIIGGTNGTAPSKMV